MTDWLRTLTAALDTLDHAAQSTMDTTHAITQATRILGDLEREVSKLDAATLAAVAPHVNALQARLELLTDRLGQTRTQIGNQLNGQRHVANALRNYGGTPK